MFLSQLNEGVGLTVCQMFTIDQTVILSASTYLNFNAE